MSTTMVHRPMPTLATRAITSTLSSHSAPSIPPASQTYEPLVKATLRHRLTHRVFVYTAICAWIITYLSILWSQGGVDTLGFAKAVLTIALPSTWAFAITMWVAAVVPVIVMRKVYLTGEHNLTKFFGLQLLLQVSKRCMAGVLAISDWLTVLRFSLSYISDITIESLPSCTLQTNYP